MEKIKNFFSKHGLVSFIVLFLVMSMNTCSKNARITKLTKQIDTLSTQSISIEKANLNEKSAELKGRLFELERLNIAAGKMSRVPQMEEFHKTEIIKPLVALKEEENK